MVCSSGQCKMHWLEGVEYEARLSSVAVPLFLAG